MEKGMGQGRMKVEYESRASAPDKEPMNALLREYYDLMISRIGEMGGATPAAGSRAIEEFWREVDQFLPPAGRLFLAKDEGGALLGSGTLKSIGGGKGELKRLFVRPGARGLGIGRKLVELRVASAKEIGLRTLLVDTLRNNVEMRSLYESLGFEEIVVYPESSSYKLVPDLQQYFRFYSMRL